MKKLSQFVVATLVVGFMSGASIAQYPGAPASGPLNPDSKAAEHSYLRVNIDDYVVADAGWKRNAGGPTTTSVV